MRKSYNEARTIGAPLVPKTPHWKMFLILLITAAIGIGIFCLTTLLPLWIIHGLIT